MAEKLFELTTVTYTAKELVIKVKNISGAALEKRLVFDLSPPAHLVDDKIMPQPSPRRKTTTPPVRRVWPAS